MQMTSDIQGDLLVVTPQEERLDAAGALAFKEQMHSHINAHADRIVLDLGHVLFLDSSGLGALVAVMKALGGTRKLELASCQPAVLKVLKLTRMDSVFTIHATDPTPPGMAAAGQAAFLAASGSK
ncbi:MAG: STAS domain-containing protein [Pseudomonadota bacterium]